MVKNYFGDYVLSKKLEAQLNELLFKALDYNICRLGYLVATGVLEPPKLQCLEELRSQPSQPV